MRVYDGMYTFANTFYVLDHRAYIYVPVDGNYTVHTGLHGAAIDDAVFFWTGDAALEGYSRGNALVCASFNTGYGITSTTFAAKAGYLPFRALFAQGDGGSGLTMSIVDPNGKTILESGYRSTELGDFIAHPRCSMTGRSQSFPNWGIE